MSDPTNQAQHWRGKATGTCPPAISRETHCCAGMHYNQAGLPAPRAKHSQPHRSRVSVQPNDRSQTVTARSPLTRRARVEERTAVANRCRQIEHGSQGLVSLSVKVHVQDLLARMRSHHRKRVSIPAGTASASKHVRHTIRKSQDRDLWQHPGRLRGEAMQRYQGCTWSRERGADDSTLLR
jgi:hypothetical protein